MATLSLPGESRSAFLAALETFAEEEGFAIRIAPLEPTEQRYSIDLRRVDVWIFGSNPFDASTYMFGVYEYASGSVGAVEGAAVLDKLISAVALVPELRVNPE